MPTPIIQGYANLTTKTGPEVPYRFSGNVFRIDAIDPSGQNRPLKYTLMQGAPVFGLGGNLVSMTPQAQGGQTTLEVKVEYQTPQPGDFAAAWLLTVFVINDPPIFSAPKSLRSDGSTTKVGFGEQGTLVLQVIARDPEARPITYGFADPNNPTPGSLTPISGPFGLEPGGTLKVVTAPPLGVYKLNVRARDEGGAYADRVFTIESINRPPVDLHIKNLVGGKGAIVQLNASNGPVFQLVATDLDQSPIEYAMLNAAGTADATVPGLTLNPQTGVVTFDRAVAVPGYYPVVIQAGDPSSVPEAQRAKTRAPVTIQVINDKPDNLSLDDVSTLTQRQFLVRAGDPDKSPPPTYGFANADGSKSTSFQGWSISDTGTITPSPAIPTGVYALPIRIEDGHKGVTIQMVQINYDAQPALMATETVQQLLKRLEAGGNMRGSNPGQRPQRYPVITLRRMTSVTSTGKVSSPLTMTVATVDDQGKLTIATTKAVDAGALDSVSKQVRLALEATEAQIIAGTDPASTATLDTVMQAHLDAQRGKTTETPPKSPAPPAFPAQTGAPPPTGYEVYR